VVKVLVFAHRLEVGGTQVNAIDLAAGLRDLHGFEVVLFATPGPLLSMAIEKGLRFVAAPDSYAHPSPARMRALRELVRREKPDIVHAWDWWQCLEAYYSVHLPMRVPLVATDMMMSLTRVLPKSLPTTFGTPELVEKARVSGRRKVELLLPPVDVKLNAPNAVNSQPFCERFGLKDHEVKLVTVSRLSNHMKAESLIRTVDAVRTLGRALPLRLIIVGEGAARSEIERLATRTNDELRRPAVILTGAFLDPRPAYAASDIVIGMGGSALRGMSFGKAVIVVGEGGFSAPFTPETSTAFYYGGIYGKGDGSPGNQRVVSQIRELVESPKQVSQLGQFSREFVVQHFSLESVCARLADLLCEAARQVPPFRVTALDGLRTAAVYVRERRFLTLSRDRVPIERVEDPA
jgi:glycosyltransferase involved in cell wall biosynthesis